MEEKKLIKRKEKAFAERNQQQLALICSDLGDFYYQHGRYNEAIREYQEEIKIRNKLGQRLEMAKAHRMLAEIYMLLSEFENALKHVNIYLKNVQQLGNKIEEQRAYATLGRIYLLQGQSADDLANSTKALKNAEKAFLKSLLLCKRLEDTVNRIELLDMQARLFLNIGVVKEHMEEYEEAISYMEKAIKEAKANDIYELLHLCYISAALLYQYKKNDHTVALRFCNLALDVAQKLPDRIKKECETLITKSEIMVKLGDFQSAKRTLHKAYKLKTPDLNDKEMIEKTLRILAALCDTLDYLVIVESTEYQARKILYEKMGDGCCLLQNYSKAIDYYLKMLECIEICRESDKELIPAYVSLYQTYKDNKQYDEALEYLWKELDINKNERTEAFNTLCNIGEIYELQKKPFWTTQDIYQKAIDEAKKSGKTHLEKIALIRLMKLQEKFKMFTLVEELKDDAAKRGIDLNNIEDDSDSETPSVEDQNTPDIGEDICLDDLTDSEAELEDTEKPRTVRKRGSALTIKRNNKGETQLHQACISGNLSLAQRLINQGHIVNVRDHAGWLPLHEACNHGHRDIVELLLDKGAVSAINDKGGTNCDGVTPLYDACSNGYLDVVELLLQRGANATLRTDFGDTALNVLEKWRKTVQLDPSEQTQYENICSTLRHQLAQAGLSNVSNSQDSNRIEGGTTRNSMDRLEMLAYGNEKVDDSEEELHQSRESNRSSNRINISRKSSWSDEDVHYHHSRRSSELRQMNISHLCGSAENEYRNVMESMRNPNRTNKSPNVREDISKKKSAYLDPSDVGDNWLENDLESNKNKRKRVASHENKISPQRKRIMSYNSKISPQKNNFTDPLFMENDKDSQDAFDILISNSHKQNLVPKSKSTRSVSSSIRQRSRKNQSSLLDNGFRQHRGESPLTTSEDSNEGVTSEADSTTPLLTNRGNNDIADVPATQIAPTVSFKVRVEDELLLVTVERKKLSEVNIRWLAEEASRRYYNLVGLRPVIRLMTADGFLFEETDTISAALEENMITSKVLEWKIAPMLQRYEEMCTQLHIDLNMNVKSALEKAQVSNCISFGNFFLTPDITEPIFKAILHQNTLKILDLSNNFIQNEGSKQLARSLLTLKQLKTLNLEGNCITYEGLEFLASTLTVSSSIESMELEELNLSFNPIGNQSIRSLEKLCTKLPKLHKLLLSTCSITDFCSFDLNFYALTAFDISCNKLTFKSFMYLLSKLNASRLQYLNLNFTSTNSNSAVGDKISEFFESGTCEKFQQINLAGCLLTDLNIYKIVETLSKSQDLEILNLAHNSKLSVVSLQYVLERLPQLKKLLLQQCTQIVKVNSLENFNISCENKSLQIVAITINDNDLQCFDYFKLFWEQLHGDRGKIKYFDNNVILYINDCDLISI